MLEIIPTLNIVRNFVYKKYRLRLSETNFRYSDINPHKSLPNYIKKSKLCLEEKYYFLGRIIRYNYNVYIVANTNVMKTKYIVIMLIYKYFIYICRLILYRLSRKND